MLLYLTDYLSQFHTGLSRVNYLTAPILGVLTALVILHIGPAMIRKLSHHQIGQVVRSDGPSTHLSKAGTLTRRCDFVGTPPVRCWGRSVQQPRLGGRW